MEKSENSAVRVFLVEDEAVILESYRVILESGGYQVTGCAYTGKQALSLIPKTPADMILMDINLPDINGMEVLQKLNPVVQIPCVFITGYFSDSLLSKATELGAFGYVIKPIEEKQLLATVHIALRRAKEFSVLRAEAQSVKAALEDRKYIERAKGILMKRHTVSEDEAMRLLQRKSNLMNQKLVAVAKEIIRAEMMLS